MKIGHWERLRHNGVAFPEPYQPLGIEISIKEKAVGTSPEVEEMVMAWARKKDTPYVNDPIFAENFMKSLRRVLPDEFSDARIDDIDFSVPFRLVDDERKAKEAMTKEDKKKLAAKRKARRQMLKERYGYAEVDGERVEVANWMVEPPGLFMGRGLHPLRGLWKPRVHPEDITLNLGNDAPIPPGKWRNIVHDGTSMWIASWKDKLSGKVKYVWLADTSSLRQERDRIKYDVATKLEGKIDAVKRKLNRMLRSKKPRVRKIATVCYLIDTLAMRVGDEKDKDEADTVGASTLRVEHITLNNSSIEFDFLGKDSVRWQKTIEGADPIVVRNFQGFLSNKKNEELVFDGITSNMVNRMLGGMMPGLTAKVFRTYCATKIVKEYLDEHFDELSGAEDFTKLYHAKVANLEAAMKCNHKRNPPKNWEENLRKKEERLEQLLASPLPKGEKAKVRRSMRINKLRLQIELSKATKEYNLNTSLRNYIDPRVYRRWARRVGLDWELIYPKTLQRKFQWARVRKV